MYRSGRDQRRAAMTAGASFVLGAVLVVTAAIGGSVTPHGATTSASSAMTSVQGSGPGQDQPAPPSDTSAVVASHDRRPACTDPISGGPGMNVTVPGRTALLIGDSQSGGAAGVTAVRTWTQTGLRAAGYDVRFVGAGGTGFVAASGSGALNYPSALAEGRWALPCVDPALIVAEGGGNDATQGATDTQIVGGADTLISTLKQTYPTSKIVMIGTLAKGAADGGGRRTAVDGVLGAYAAGHHVDFISAGDWLTRYGARNQLADGVHLTQAGHDHLAAVLTTQLTSMHLTAADLERQP